MSPEDPSSRSVDPRAADRADLLAAWTYAGTRVRSRPLGATDALAELTAWLDDARQCQNAAARNWKSQLNDVLISLKYLITITKDEDRAAIESLVAEVAKARSQVRGHGGISEWTRTRLRLASDQLNELLDSPTLLASAWSAIELLSKVSPQRALLAVHAALDLVCRRGPLEKDVLRDVKGALRGERDTPASTCIENAKQALFEAGSATVEVVWVRIVEARLHEPPVLAIGDAVLLVADSVFVDDEVQARGLTDHAPELAAGDRRGGSLFPDARTDDGDVGEGSATAADGRDADKPPAVYARVRIPPTPVATAYRRACEQLEFLLGFVSTKAAVEDVWHFSGSHWLVGSKLHFTRNWYDPVAAWKGAGSDETARILGEHAGRLAPHLPLTQPRWITAGLLLTWLREASRAEPATCLILCDRVLEQVAGWAGFDDPQELVAGPVRTAWRRAEVLHLIDSTYIHLLNADWSRELPSIERIVVVEEPPPHSAPAAFPTRSRPKIIELAETLAEDVPAGTAAAFHLLQLQQLVRSKPKTVEFLAASAAEFDRRNAHLRRTRNALLHGGPIVASSVEHVSGFALTLANFALGAALEIMLADRDLAEGLVEAERDDEACLQRLIAGVAWSEALFVG